MFERLNNNSCVLTESCGHRGRKFNTVVYSPAIESIAGDVLPVSWFQNFLLNLYQETKDSRWCLPAIDSIAGVHIAQFCRFRDVFSRYCINKFHDFSCVLPVSINSGKTHQKSPAESIYLFSSVSADFVIIVFWQIFSSEYWFPKAIVSNKRRQ